MSGLAVNHNRRKEIPYGTVRLVARRYDNHTVDYVIERYQGEVFGWYEGPSFKDKQEALQAYAIAAGETPVVIAKVIVQATHPSAMVWEE